MRTGDINPYAAQKMLQAFLSADLKYQLAGIPHAETLRREAQQHRGQARRLLLLVADLGPDAKRWMDYFIESMAA